MAGLSSSVTVPQKEAPVPSMPRMSAASNCRFGGQQGMEAVMVYAIIFAICIYSLSIPVLMS